MQLATLQELARYWTTDYDWRKVEAKLNALPQFTTEIDGVEIHFIHVRSRHEDALPLIMTHGWPGSVIELLETVGPLTDPTATAAPPGRIPPGAAVDAGYGFSGEPAELGWDASRTARAWAELMHRLGYTRYVAQGGDVGALVTDLMGRQAVEGLVGYHLNLLTAVLAIGDQLPRNPNRNAQRPRRSRRSGRTASATSSRWRRGRRRSATPCWIHLSGWRPGCSITTRTATTRCPARSSTGSRWESHSGEHRRQHHAVLADGHRTVGGPVVLGGRTSAGRSARERPATSAVSAGRLHPFPGEIWASPRSWVEAVYPGLAYFNEVDRGGHFAAWEEPELFSTEVRAAFSSLR